jgi:hypothetical protein
MLLNSYLFVFQYSKLIGGFDFVSFDKKKKTALSAYLFTPEHKHFISYVLCGT